MDIGHLSQHAGTITIAGVTYPVTKYTLDDTGAIREWLRQKLPHPFDVAREGLERLMPDPDPPVEPLSPGEAPQAGTPPEVAADYQRRVAEYAATHAAYTRAHRRWQRLWDEYKIARELLLTGAREDVKAGNHVSNENTASQLMSSVEGVAYQLFLSIRRAQKDVTLQQLIDGLRQEDLEAVLAKIEELQLIPLELEEAIRQKKAGVIEKRQKRSRGPSWR